MHPRGPETLIPHGSASREAKSNSFKALTSTGKRAYNVGDLHAPVFLSLPRSLLAILEVQESIFDCLEVEIHR